MKNTDKPAVRDLHKQAVSATTERARRGLERHEDRLIGYFAHGTEVDPLRMRPVLKEVVADSEDELLFRYARLHWSIPVSRGYGRRLRFLIFDDHTNKLIGLIGLGDPVFRLGPRDSWIGWTVAARMERLRYVMDAFVLGAVPPYSYLLCGKLVAMLVASSDVSYAFAKKYAGSTSLIADRPFDGKLAMVTTTSALGRSSLYNRLSFGARKLFVRTGFTSGSGEFHFANGVYHDLADFAREYCVPAAKNMRWGAGWRSRRELVRAVLPILGLSRELVYHGVEREVFVVPLAENAREFLCARASELTPYRMTAEELFAWFRERWLLPRARRDFRYQDFDANTLRIWSASHKISQG